MECRECAVCGGSFTVQFPSNSKRCCSLACGHIFKRQPRTSKACAACGKPIVGTEANLARRLYCSLACGSPAAGRKPRATYAEGIYIDRDGYRIITIREPGTRRRRVREHRWVMEQHLGRKLDRREIVHHINHDRLDNRIENLEVIDSQSEHIKREHPQKEGWSRNYVSCVGCGTTTVRYRGRGKCANCYERTRTRSTRST